MVFGDDEMKRRLPPPVYASLKKSIDGGLPLDPAVADDVAAAMMAWAVEKGATHYTHWFQPMNNITAGKHDSFLSIGKDGKPCLRFSGKELIKGEPDASSFPNGGLRNTFEARGYTTWDCTSPAFVRDGTLYIPTAFCSYTGEALDTKTPLLRSMSVISEQAMRLLRLFGNKTATRVTATVGAEQEYFLIDRALYEKRLDLKICGRTLYGAKPAKGQEMEDHYFGRIRLRVAAFMKELDEALWRLGVTAKTKHNEVAPAQHELAPIFDTVNIAGDHNQLTMEVMRIVAKKNGLACLLHEKPFAGVNGSGKHNNWSICTDTGINLLEPGESPEENAQFLLFLTAILEAVDKHQDLLRLSVASAGNDHRLGSSEAPPAIISVFLGDELTGILESIENKSEYDQKDAAEMNIGVDVLPKFPKDATDRNRTSPFAFTGNKFEFRMLGSTVSIACPNMILNTIVADTLCRYADRLEKAEDFNKELNHIIRHSYRDHKRIVFNGNNYAPEWVEEAKRRGLLNLESAADALPYYKRLENIELFEKYGVLSGTEIVSRCEIQLENYCKQIHIEALTMVDMIKKDILPAACAYMKDISKEAINKKQLCADISCELEETLLKKLSQLTADLYKEMEALEAAVAGAEDMQDVEQCAKYYRNPVLMQMEKTRAIADEIECNVGEKYWPYPTYGDLLFSVR